MECLRCEGRGQVAARGLAGISATGTKLTWRSCDECDGRGWLTEDDEAEVSLDALHTDPGLNKVNGSGKQ